MNQISTKAKFGDFLQSTGTVKLPPTIYYIDPFLRQIEPAYLIGGNPVPKYEHLIQIVCLLVPKEFREQPIDQLDPTTIRKISFICDKNLSMALVNTKPPTIYSVTEQELATWIKFSM